MNFRNPRHASLVVRSTRRHLAWPIEPWISELWTRDHHECVRLRTYPFSLAGLAALAVDGGDWLRQRLFPETDA